jgi:hypothetical protein
MGGGGEGGKGSIMMTGLSARACSVLAFPFQSVWCWGTGGEASLSHVTSTSFGFDQKYYFPRCPKNTWLYPNLDYEPTQAITTATTAQVLRPSGRGEGI